MKARDIIPGWPRGHSTSRPFAIDPVERFMWNLRVNVPPLPSLSLRCCMRLFNDDEADVAYHDGQNRMMDRYIKEQCIDVTPMLRLRSISVDAEALRNMTHENIRRYRTGDLE